MQRSRHLSAEMSSKLTVAMHQLNRLAPDRQRTGLEGDSANASKTENDIKDWENVVEKLVSLTASILKAESLEGTERQWSELEQWIRKQDVENNKNPHARAVEDPSNTAPNSVDPNISGNTVELSNEDFVTSLFNNDEPDSPTVPELDQRLSGISISTDPDSDFKYEAIQNWLSSATQRFDRKEYQKAEMLLEKIMVESEKKYNQDFPWRDKVIRMRVYSCCQLGKWVVAGELLDQRFDGRSELMETLVKGYLKQGKRSDAERILAKEFDGKEAIMDSLALLYFQDKKWNDAKRILLDLQKYDSDEIAMLQRMHMLAEVCFAKKEFVEAAEFCLNAIEGRQLILGRRHHLFYQSVNLLARISEASGEIDAAQGYKQVLATLPPGIHGMFPLPKWNTD